MLKSKDVLARPSIGSKCVYDPGSLDGSAHIYGKYFVEIIRYIHDMPVCRILEVIEKGGINITTHTVGKEVFFISVSSLSPNEILKEII